MPDGIDFKLEGMEEVLGRLDSLSHDIKYKGGRFAMRKAAQLVARAAADNAKQLDDPRSADDISQNIVNGNKYPGLRFSNRRFKNSGDVMFRVGVSGGAGGNSPTEKVAAANAGGDTRHWRQQEFGNRNHKAQPFMRRALAENVDKAVAEFGKHFGPAMDRAIKRAKKKA